MPESAWIASLVASGLALALAGLRAGMWVNDVNRDRQELKETVRALLAAHRDVLVKLYKQNPRSRLGEGSAASQKDLLLEKLGAGTISYEEALELREILKQERKKATAMHLIAIGGLLALLDVVIEASQPPKIKAKGGK